MSAKEVFCYEVILKDSVKDRAYRYMQEDLDRRFGFKSSLRMKRQSVFVLQRLTKSPPFIKEAERKRGGDNYHADGKHVFKNIRPGGIVTVINQSGQLPLPLVDESGIETGIDVALTDNANDMVAIQKDFEKVGLRLVQRKRRISVIVLEIKKSSR